MQGLACQGGGPFLLDAGLRLQEAKSVTDGELELLASVSEANMSAWGSLGRLDEYWGSWQAHPLSITCKQPGLEPKDLSHRGSLSR